MNGAAIIVAAFPALLIMGVLLAPLLARHERSARRGNGGDTAPVGNEQLEDAEIPDVPPPSAAGGDRYFAEWSALQAKFNEQAAEANATSNDLITATF
jgi:hypothetical protein